MNPSNVRTRLPKILHSGLALTVLGVLLLVGPFVIRNVYRANTSGTLIDRQKAAYFRLEAAEPNLTGMDRMASMTARHRLSLWLSARGFHVDPGGDCGDSYRLWEQWRELIDYWRTDAD